MLILLIMLALLVPAETAVGYTDTEPRAHASGCHTKKCWERVREARKERWCRTNYRCVWKQRYHAQPVGWRIWAVGTGSCESGNTPSKHDLATGRTFHGSHQFVIGTWNAAQNYLPKRWRRYGDPHVLSWNHQATAAIILARREGKGHWPVCGRR
jgi:hypothetical protein